MNPAEHCSAGFFVKKVPLLKQKQRNFRFDLQRLSF